MLKFYLKIFIWINFTSNKNILKLFRVAQMQKQAQANPRKNIALRLPTLGLALGADAWHLSLPSQKCL